MDTKGEGELKVVPTPIGNLEDMTLRGIRTLKEADIIACEDTRVTGNLLKHLEIPGKKLISLHAHNEKGRTGELVRLMSSGTLVALVSDAGTPGFSDPGSVLIAGAIEAGIRVEVLPGANAAVPALVGSGLRTRPVLFEGFLPHKKGRQRRLKELTGVAATIILYESPHRLLRLLNELIEHFGPEVPGVVAREISKMYEEYIRGTLGSLLEELERRGKVRGEIVVLVGAGELSGERDVGELSADA